MNRLALYGIALGAVLLALWGWGHSRYSAGERAAEARMQALVNAANEKANRTTKLYQDNADRLEKSHATQIADLDARLAAAIARAPRVPVCPRPRRVPETPTDAGQRDEDRREQGSDPEDGGRDIAPQLLEYARDAEELRLALQTCQAYGREIDLFRR